MADIVEKSISFSAIEEIAGKIRKFIDSKFPDTSDIHSKLRAFVTLLNGEVLIADSPDAKEINGGSLVIYNDGKFKIYLSPHTSPLRDNFTIAHELGHYFLHADLNATSSNKYIYFNRYGSDTKEAQANRFAASLLMPKDEFKQKHTEYNGDITLLSGYFGVSSPAVTVRKSCLNLS